MRNHRRSGRMTRPLVTHWHCGIGVLESSSFHLTIRSHRMFDRMSNGFDLARSTWRVLLKDKHLLVFPAVSGILFVIVLASFAVPLATLVDWNQVQQQANAGKVPIWWYAVVFAFYFCTYFVTIFC